MEAEKQKKVLADVEAFCREIRPIEELCYLEHRFNDQAIPLACKHDILGMPVPEQYGGRGADPVTYVRALARIGQEGTGVRSLFAHSSLGQLPLVIWGTEEQKHRFLPGSTTGDKIIAFGLTEPEAGSNPLEMRMTYRREAGQFLLNGVKYLISNGGIANLIVTFAYPEEGMKRISAFIVETDKPGIEREDLVAKMGMPTSNTAMFELVDYPVPLDNLLGQEGDGLRIALDTLITGRLTVTAGCLGVIEDCLQESIDYARQRHQHGKPIGKHQLVQDHIARIEIARQATDAFLVAAAEAKSASLQDPGNPELYRRADLLAAEAKYFASHAAWEAADHAVQVFGGRGYSDLFRPARHLKDIRVARIYEGTDEILKLKIAAAVLGKGFEAYR